MSPPERSAWLQQLIDRIDAYCQKTGYSPSYISARAVNDGSLYKRMMEGATITMATYERVSNYLTAAERDLASGVWQAKASYKATSHVKATRGPRKKR